MNKKRRMPWIAQQTWRNVLFIHFPVPYEKLKKYIPKPFTLETYNGQAWIGIILFEALHSRFRGMPKSMSFRYFLQLNIRTYVRFGEEPGVFFFSIDANRKLPVMGARFVSLPYFFAQMEMDKYKKNFHFKSRRIENNHPGNFKFDVEYRPISEPFISKKDSLVYWFTERYCIWTIKGKKIYKAPISHDPWMLQQATIQFNVDHGHSFLKNINTHYCQEMNAHIHPFEQKGIYFC